MDEYEFERKDGRRIRLNLELRMIMMDYGRGGMQALQGELKLEEFKKEVRQQLPVCIVHLALCAVSSVN